MALLEVDGLGLSIEHRSGRRIPILNGVTLDVQEGKALALIGESGSGKSMTARAVMRLVPHRSTVTGSIRFDGNAIEAMDDRELRQFRAHDVAMVYQDPRSHINPVRTVGDFLTEGMLLTTVTNRSDATARALHLMDEVGIVDGPRRLGQYPHELSGGLLQRVMIAAALACSPRLLLADEPTTALDVTTQSEVMAVLADLREQHGLAMLFITHDLDLALSVCDDAAVMQGGRILEALPAAVLRAQAQHPYTKMLMAARPPFLSAAGGHR
jgi:ABC-type dipeptide/oligopeptide/nickel transport system ATPase component